MRHISDVLGQTQPNWLIDKCPRLKTVQLEMGLGDDSTQVELIYNYSFTFELIDTSSTLN